MQTFPMFLKMKNRLVLIIGGGEQAAQKTRLILKTDAKICVLAEHLNSELSTFSKEGRINHITGPLTVDLLQSAILTFSATGCAGAGAAHAALAEQANSIINVVDMPEHCEAMTPSIVDRDPFVVAIGTEGNAPLLGRQVKSKIETILEPGLGRLVSFAGAMRSDVAHHIDEKQRRPFWNWVFNGLPRQEFEKGNERHAFSMIKDKIRSQDNSYTENGKIIFIEAFERDPDLIRLKDLKDLQEADIIFYEHGFHEEILELARRDAQRQSYNNINDIHTTVDKHIEHSDCNIVVISSRPINKNNNKPILKVIA